MNKAKRKAIIAGNWKMNMTVAGTEKLIDELIPLVKGLDGCETVICVPFTDLWAASAKIKGTGIKLGAQNVHFEPKGAYTGEISADMLKEIGTDYVIIGHSERRTYFAETDKTVNLRAKAALGAGIKVIMCVGETLDQREKGETEKVISDQIDGGLDGFTAEQMKNTVIAYEPVWAIGTGRTATPEQAEEVCGYIRKLLSGKFGKEVSDSVAIQYGGSMNAANAAELLAKENIDGGLIGGASLKPANFAVIVKAAQ